MSELPAVGLGGKSPFSEAERGVILIPCGDNKVPLVKHPQKFGSSASREIANKFSDASAFGYYYGKRNGITVLDVDTTHERVLADAMNRHGRTPIVVRTGSGKFHALYRHNNERRCVRAWDGLPIDLLGAGLAIAPPSLVAKGQYQIIHGHLDDLDRLPIMRE
jgi:Bifunctional DNA primase/polymerase, N-terminal